MRTLHKVVGLGLFIILIVTTLLACNSVSSASEIIVPTRANVRYAGVRSSDYGINPFPSAVGWGKAINKMASYFIYSQPIAIWVVGTIDGNGTCLEFPKDPSDTNRYLHITFTDTDKHESYLRYFDQNGIKVFLQVEPGFSDVPTLINLVLKRYGSHPCVIGFGIDVEWYKNVTDHQPGTALTQAEVQTWEAQVKSYQNSYRLFVKHYAPSYLDCNGYRGNIVFVDDSQQFSSLSKMIDEYRNFANNFKPNTVLFQVGYQADRGWWQSYKNPPEVVGDALAAVTEQECGIIWVDFTLRKVLPAD